jgi:hypothetical protein
VLSSLRQQALRPPQGDVSEEMQTSANEAVQMHFEVSSQRIAYYRANLTAKEAFNFVTNFPKTVASQKLAVSLFGIVKARKVQITWTLRI